METLRQPTQRDAPRRRTAWLALADDEVLGPLMGRLAAATCLRIVGDGSTFRDALLTERPRLALACLPPAGDAELALLASERKRRTGLRTVLLNERDDVETRLTALRLGFDECLDLGVTPDELAGRLELLAERVDASPREHRLAIADGLELDLDAHVLLREGTPVHLRPKEFGLLEFLARHPARAHSRRQLLTRVWGADHGADARTVDVHVRWLRAKVELDPEHPTLLTTVRGVGYRLVPEDR